MFHLGSCLPSGGGETTSQSVFTSVKHPGPCRDIHANRHGISSNCFLLFYTKLQLNIETMEINSSNSFLPHHVVSAISKTKKQVNDANSWRIMPVSKWLITMVIAFVPQGSGCGTPSTWAYETAYKRG